ncbi:MAG: heavy metal-associated domain-containing protein [Anaerococcus sp.]|jgi:copper chaperone CopZ|nr:heavy metal-associated domain-containing protein [Peptoniphilaceae bacterium]MDY3055213.1 heavy metal-associated domain-containing protein [Anaerococcus sp.]
MKKKFKLENLGCANCAAQMEEKINKLDGVKNASVSFMTENLKIEVENEEDLDDILNKSQEIISSLEPDARIKR